MRCELTPRRGPRTWILLAALAGLWSGCDSVDCTRQSDCASGFYCTEALTCLPVPPDAGPDLTVVPDLRPGPDLLPCTPSSSMSCPDLQPPSDLSGDMAPPADFSTPDMAATVDASMTIDLL